MSVSRIQEGAGFGIFPPSHPGITRESERKALSDLPPRFWVQRRRCRRRAIALRGSSMVYYKAKRGGMESSADLKLILRRQTFL